MTACPSCGTENPEGSRFCNGCGSPLGAATPRPVAEERKVVTALFCDLVGFTATSESADPEDVDRMLAAYFEMARAQIEGHGGVVEKFIGDAVVGVFGVPAAHEDDPERAVRAGLRICEDAEDLTSVGGAPLKLRVGVNTGEALVRLGVSAALGRRVPLGDSVNTASRIQSVAPEMGVAVGLGTYEATAQVFDYAELEPATLKGKSEPVRVFHAKSPLAASAPTSPAPTTPRSSVARSTWRCSRASSTRPWPPTSPQLVTVVGEPGLGKSRIVAELGRLHRHEDPSSSPGVRAGVSPTGRASPSGRSGRSSRPTRGSWSPTRRRRDHQARRRCSPREQSAPGSANASCRCSGSRRTPPRSARSCSPRGDGSWSTSPSNAPRCSCSRTCTGPMPRCSRSWNTWPNGPRRSRSSWSAPRAPSCSKVTPTTATACGTPPRSASPALRRGDRTPRLGPAGNDRGPRRAPTADPRARRWEPALRRGVRPAAEGQGPARPEGPELGAARRRRGPVPRLGAGPDRRTSGHALGQTRSRCSPTLRSIGKVFWAGAIAQMGERDLTAVTETLRELSRKELVRPARRSSIEGEAEYAFWHILARDVAYCQLPRASRAARHVAAARWIESKAPERVEDLADVLAYHYATALELAQAAGQAEQAPELEAPALEVPHPRRRAGARPEHRRGAVEPRAGARARPGRTPRASRGARALR